MPHLGIAVIGQAPRDDIAAIFWSALPAGTRISVRGCFDGLSEAEVDALRPRSGDDTLYTRLRGERDVKISKAAVIERAPATLDALRGDGADALLFACTGAFPPIRSDAGGSCFRPGFSLGSPPRSFRKAASSCSSPRQSRSKSLSRNGRGGESRLVPKR